jgi:hypothetical protein
MNAENLLPRSGGRIGVITAASSLGFAEHTIRNGPDNVRVQTSLLMFCAASALRLNFPFFRF